MSIVQPEVRTSHQKLGYGFGVIAALSCPCHLPILAVLLAGTTAGAFLSANLAMVVVAAAAIFVVSLRAAIRLLGSPSGDDARAELH